MRKATKYVSDRGSVFDTPEAATEDDRKWAVENALCEGLGFALAGAEPDEQRKNARSALTRLEYADRARVLRDALTAWIDLGVTP